MANTLLLTEGEGKDTHPQEQEDVMYCPLLQQTTPNTLLHVYNYMLDSCIYKPLLGLFSPHVPFLPPGNIKLYPLINSNITIKTMLTIIKHSLISLVHVEQTQGEQRLMPSDSHLTHPVLLLHGIYMTKLITIMIKNEGKGGRGIELLVSNMQNTENISSKIPTKEYINVIITN